MVKVSGKEPDPIRDSVIKIKENITDFGSNVKEKWDELKFGQKISKVGNNIQSGVKSIEWEKLSPGNVAEKLYLKQAASAVYHKIRSIKKPDLTEINEFEERISPYLPTEIAKKWYHQYRGVTIDTKKNVVLDWTKVYGWRLDPFNTAVLQPITDYYIIDKGIKNRLNLFLIKKHKFGAITGEKGTGKTALALWLLEELRHHKGQLYASYIDPQKKIKNEADLMRQVIKPFTSMYEKVLKQVHEDIPLATLIPFIKEKIGKSDLYIVIDDPQEIPERFMQIFVSLYQSTEINVHIIVIAMPETFKATIFNSKDYKDMLHITLKEAPEELLKMMLERRIQAVGGHETFPFESRSIGAISKKVKGNPHDFLRFCREKAMKMSLEERDKIIEKMAEIKRLQAEEKRLREEERKQLRDVERQEGTGSALTKLQDAQEYVSQSLKQIMGKRDSPTGNATKSSSIEEKQIDEIDKILTSELDSALKKDKYVYEERSDSSVIQRNDQAVSSIKESLPQEEFEESNEPTQKRKSNKELQKAEEEIAKLIKETEGKRRK